jgi:hypothetical protein
VIDSNVYQPKICMRHSSSRYRMFKPSTEWSWVEERESGSHFVLLEDIGHLISNSSSAQTDMISE